MTPQAHHSAATRVRSAGRGTTRGGRGFTLVESLIATVILAIAVIGIAGTLAATYQQSKEQTSSAESTQLARQLMEEISAKPFVLPVTEAVNTPGYAAGNTNRAQYDEISDYHGFTDVSTNIKTL